MFKQATILVAALCFLTSCNYETVDDSPALMIADKFYGSLKVSDGKTALSLFSSDFKKAADTWPRLLESLQKQGGAVTSNDLRAASLVAQSDSPCFLLSYSVKRQAANSGTEEQLFVCRSPSAGSKWLIAGHAIRRNDNGKSIQAGILPTEVGVRVP